MPTTRLAPSPTGALHLGNARTFLVNWLLARQQGWRIVLRIEDIDGPRIKRGADHSAIRDLQWLGIDWDGIPIYQSTRMDHYRRAVATLLQSGDAYACVCSRKEAEAAASAPHGEDGTRVYPGTCRDRFTSPEEALRIEGRAPAIRFRVPDGIIQFQDAVAGRQQFDLARQLGDFVISKADGTPAYQLAVVVDDADMGITHVVRGNDLLESTPRQILLYKTLGFASHIPSYFHLPLIVGRDGKRLAKRHGDTRLSFYREQGVPAPRVLALLARWCGIEADPRGIHLHNLIESFRLENLPRERIVFTETDDEWLRK